jgi:Fibronectin type III domain
MTYPMEEILVRLSISHFYPHVSALLVLAVSLAGSCITAFAGEVGLAWDAKTEPEIVGYKIYYQGITHSDLRSIDVGNVTTYTVTGLYPDTYGFCVTAYDTSGNETGGSNIVSTTLSPPMYGFRDASALSQRGDASLAGLYSRSLSENHRCSRSAQKDLFASRFHPVVVDRGDGDRILTRPPDPRISIHCSA